jgi:hypothetical protein
MIGDREYLAGHYDPETLDALDEGPALGTFADYFLTYCDFQHPILHGPFPPNAGRHSREFDKAIDKWQEDRDHRMIYLYMTEAMVSHWPACYRVRP